MDNNAAGETKEEISRGLDFSYYLAVILIEKDVWETKEGTSHGQDSSYYLTVILMEKDVEGESKGKDEEGIPREKE
jgi:hypothetical protein